MKHQPVGGDILIPCNSSDEALMSTGFIWALHWSSGATSIDLTENWSGPLAAVLPRMMGAIWPDVLS